MRRRLRASAARAPTTGGSGGLRGRTIGVQPYRIRYAHMFVSVESSQCPLSRRTASGAFGKGDDMRMDFGEISLYYEVHGDTGNDARPWLVFSHSLACHAGMW